MSSKEFERHLRAERQNRGTGTGASYKPWIQLRRHDFASRGRSHMHPSALFDRHVELLSDLELYAYLHIQLLTPWDVREQFRLQTHDVGREFEATHPESLGTVAIAKALGVQHPQFNRNHAMPFTTDFLVNLRSGSAVAVHVKYETELVKKRAAELRAIEAEYWRQRGVALVVFSDKQVNAKEIANLQMFSSFNRKNIAHFDRGWLPRLALLAQIMPMRDAIERLSHCMGLRVDEIVDGLKYAGAIGLIRLDLTKARLRWSELWPAITVGPSDDLLYLGTSNA